MYSCKITLPKELDLTDKEEVKEHKIKYNEYCSNLFKGCKMTLFIENYDGKIYKIGEL